MCVYTTVRAKRGKTSPPVIEQVAEMAMRLSGPDLADYGATRSRNDFTQRRRCASTNPSDDRAPQTVIAAR